MHVLTSVTFVYAMQGGPNPDRHQSRPSGGVVVLVDQTAGARAARTRGRTPRNHIGSGAASACRSFSGELAAFERDAAIAKNAELDVPHPW